MNEVLSDLLGKLVEVKHYEHQPTCGVVRAVSANANGFHFIVQAIDEYPEDNRSRLRGFVMHECIITLLVKCERESCKSLPAFPAHKLSEHNAQYHPPRCRWNVGFGKQCERYEGHDGEHTCPRNEIHIQEEHHE